MYKYNMGGSVPRETNIGGQRHSLAYINPFEEDLLNTQYRGGEGQPMPPVPGPGGIPAYPPTGRKDGSGYTTTAPKTTTYKRGSGRDERLQEEANKNKAANLQNTLDTLASDANKQAAESMLLAGVTNVGGSGPAKRAEQKIKLQKTLDTLTAGAARQNEIDAADNREKGIAPAAAVAPSVNVGPQGPLAVETSVRPVIRPDDLKGERTGIMGIVDDIVRGGKTILSDIRMGITANPFGSLAEQRKNLENLKDADGNRVYSDFEIDEYFLATAESQERMKNQPIFRDDDKDMAAAVIDDSCPEGYKLDPITNECVMDDTIDVLNPGGQQVTDFVMPSVNPVIGQAANYTGAVAPTNMPMPLQPYAPGTSGNLLQSSAPGLARTRAGGIMGL
jgi:hypothetical protein